MAKLTKEQAIKAGGNIWEKGGIERVYLNTAACKALIAQNEFSKMEESSLKKAKTFFDIKTGELKSDVGTVRVMFNRADIECGK